MLGYMKNEETRPDHCDGCDQDAETRTYDVTHHDGTTSPRTRYCADCADLARMDWNGETAAIVACQ